MQDWVLESQVEVERLRSASLLCSQARAEVCIFLKGGNLPDVITWSFEQGLTGAAEDQF